MNTCYHENTQEKYEYTSAVYPTQTMTVAHRARIASRSFVGRIAALFAALFSLIGATNGRRVVRVVTIAVCFFAFLGVIGSVEAGVLSIGFGILISAFLLFLEILCLR